jgi:hypothetical protein
MPAYFNGKVINIGSNSFVADDGEKVSYNIVTIAHDDGSILTVNSKSDVSKYLNVPATITLSLRQEGKLYKVSLKEISTLGVVDPKEKEIE